ncbi:glycerophosphoryl diester phosphodiesterase membrane domain-containing protein [Streptomyces bacillaris]
MNDSPGWATPGSAPSDGQEAAIPRPTEPKDGSAPTGQWSPEQPPPGQWSPPSNPAGGPGARPPAPGWGGGPQHRPWGTQPPAAKPGVIPLRPLGLGEILDGSVSALRAHWRTALGFSLAVSVVVQIAVVLMQRYLLPTPTDIDPNASGTEALRQASESLRTTLFSLAPTSLFTMIATLLTASIVTVVISRSVLGRPVTLSDAWAEARPRLLPLIGLTLLVTLAIALVMTLGIGPGLLMGSGGGVALAFLGFLAACAVILWLQVSLALAAPALMLERQGIFAALRRSAKLVRGAWWRTFGILALTYLIVFLLSFVVSIPFTAIAVIADGIELSEFFESGGPSFGWPFLIVTGIGEVIVSTLLYPFVAGVMALLYVDQRIRREALDLDLARAAGLPDHDTDTPRS